MRTNCEIEDIRGDILTLLWKGRKKHVYNFGITFSQARSLDTLQIAGRYRFRCEFVLRMKGVDFVRRLRDAHPNLNRPSIRNAISLDVPPNEIRRNPRNPPVERINMTELENMGFTRTQIERAISRYCEGSQDHNEEHAGNITKFLTPAFSNTADLKLGEGKQIIFAKSSRITKQFMGMCHVHKLYIS